MQGKQERENFIQFIKDLEEIVEERQLNNCSRRQKSRSTRKFVNVQEDDNMKVLMVQSKIR